MNHKELLYDDEKAVLIKEARGYMITSLGRVITVKSDNHSIMKPCINKRGYHKIALYDKGRLTLYIHRLVGCAFVDNPDNKNQINHIDGNKTNNNFNNLEWCTAKENTQHAFKTQLNCNQGEKNVNAKLTAEQVLEIRMLLKHKLAIKKVAGMYNVSTGAICAIKYNKTWKSI